MVWRFPGPRRLQHQCRQGRCRRSLRSIGLGKSTLIKCVNGLEPFQQGEIHVDDISVGDTNTNLPRLRSRIGMVFQNFELFPHISVTGEHQAGPAQGAAGAATSEAHRQGDAACCSASGWPTRPTSTRRNSPAASSSVSPSRARSPWTRSRCCSTNRPRRSTRR